MAKRRDRQGLTEAEFLAAYDPDRYPKPAVTADIVILNDRDEVLLVRRGGHPFLDAGRCPAALPIRMSRWRRRQPGSLRRKPA